MKYVNVCYNASSNGVVVFWILKIQMGVEWAMNQIYLFPLKSWKMLVCLMMGWLRCFWLLWQLMAWFIIVKHLHVVSGCLWSPSICFIHQQPWLDLCSSGALICLYIGCISLLQQLLLSVRVTVKHVSEWHEDWEACLVITTVLTINLWVVDRIYTNVSRTLFQTHCFKVWAVTSA